MEEKITLDKESFRSLASETRISILKSLDRRRKMLTELSKELGMSPSTVKEHMDNLCSAGLTVQIDDGHKWKYYELTRKGGNILHPHETRIWIILSASVLGVVGIFYDMLTGASQSLMTAAKAGGDTLARTPMTEAVPAGAGVQAVSSLPMLPVVHIAALMILSVLIGACAAYMVLGRRKMLKSL
jgi:DNA-binding transcriptional ArsR family regulator